MNIDTRIMASSFCSSVHAPSLTSDIAKYMPKCHPELVNAATRALSFAKEQFSNGINLTELSAYQYGDLGKAVTLVNQTVCNVEKAGSKCFELVWRRFLPTDGSDTWSDLVQILNWNCTGSVLGKASRKLPGNEFWYQAISNAKSQVFERLHIGGFPKIHFMQSAAPSINGSITKLPMLTEICTKLQQISKVVKPAHSTLLPLFATTATAVAGCWALSRAVKATNKTSAIAYGLLGIASFAASVSSTKLL